MGIAKKLWMLAMCGCIVSVSALTGCSNQKEAAVTTGGGSEAPDNFNPEGYPIVNDKITVSMMGYKSPIQGPWDKLKFFNTMEEKTNISFTFNNPPADGYQEKKNLIFACGEYPEVFFGASFSPEDEIKYGMKEGILIPLNDLIDQYAPNIQKMFEEKPEVKKSITTPDGNIYVLPTINEAPIATTNMTWLNYEWLENLNITDLPSTTDELYDMLVRFKNEDPNQNGEADEIPYSNANDADAISSLNYHIAPAFGVLNVKFYVDDQGKVQYGYMHPNYKEYITYVNKLYGEGLIDQDIFNMTGAELSAKGKSNRLGMAQHAIPQLIFDCNDIEKAAKYPVLPVLTSEFNDEAMISKGSGIGRGSFAITDKCENPEAIIRWVDYLYSEEGSIYIHYGEENDLWKFADNGLREYIIPEDGRSVEEKRGGEITPDCGTACPKWVRSETEGGWNDVAHQNRIKECDEKIYPNAKLSLPDMYFLPEEQGRIQTILTDVDKLTKETEAKFATGQLDIDKEYDKFIDTLKKMGIEEVISIYQTAYDRWNSTK